eukprot:1895266-Rhodomonas_salina.2
MPVSNTAMLQPEEDKAQAEQATGSYLHPAITPCYVMPYTSTACPATSCPMLTHVWFQTALRTDRAYCTFRAVDHPKWGPDRRDLNQRSAEHLPHAILHDAPDPRP